MRRPLRPHRRPSQHDDPTTRRAKDAAQQHPGETARTIAQSTLAWPTVGYYWQKRKTQRPGGKLQWLQWGPIATKAQAKRSSRARTRGRCDEMREKCSPDCCPRDEVRGRTRRNAANVLGHFRSDFWAPVTSSTKRGHNLTNFGPSRATFGRHRIKLAWCGPKLVKLWPKSVEICRGGPEIARKMPARAQFWPMLAGFARSFANIRPKFGKC